MAGDGRTASRADAPAQRASPRGAIALAGRAGRLVGRVCFWQGGSLWIGVGRGKTDWHDHHAHQLAFSLGAPFTFRADPAHAAIQYTGTFVPSHRKHQFEAEGPLAHVFVEPESVEGRALAARFGDERITPLPDEESGLASARLAGALQDDAGSSDLIAIGRAAVAALARVSSRAAPVDPRVTKAIELLRSRIRTGASLADAAAAAALSPSRFRHLFVDETGTSFRAYILWLRLNVAIQTAMQGRSWTEAAHDAGFADSAHLTRTFRRMFGINPATLVFH